MYRVLLAVDPQESPAVAQAQFVVDLPGADRVHVTVLHSWSGHLDDLPEDVVGTQTIDHVASVRRVTSLFDDHGVSYDLVDGSGDPADLIVEVAEDVGARLVVVGGHRRSPVGKALFGSVTQEVVLGSPVPVVVVNE